MSISFQNFKANAVQFAAGWSLGASFAGAKASEVMYKQGGHTMLAALCQIFQIVPLCAVGSQLAEHLPASSLKTRVKFLCAVAPFVSVPCCLLNGYVVGNGSIPIKPIAGVLRFTNKHIGSAARVAILAGSLAMISLGQRVQGAALCLALAYEGVDSLGYVPRKISLFIEKHISVVSHIAQIFTGNVTTKFFSAIHLSLNTSSSFHRALHTKIDSLYRKLVNKPSPALREVDTPVVERTSLTVAEIKNILNKNVWEFSVSPSHAASSVFDLQPLPENKNADLLLNFFNSVSWHDEEHRKLIYSKLNKDERFITIIQEKIAPEKSIKQIQAEFNFYLESLSKDTNTNPTDYLFNWFHLQLTAFVKIMKGEERVTGLQQDLDDAIPNCYKIIAYLSSLDQKNKMDKRETDDILLKLAVEGGNYCALGIKRACHEVVSQIMQSKAKTVSHKDEQLDYKTRLLATLQEKRRLIYLAEYASLIRDGVFLAKSESNSHIEEIFQTWLGLGFYPITRHQRKAFGFKDLFHWEVYARLRAEMYMDYKNQLSATVDELGKQAFGLFLQILIQNNPSLSASEQQEILYMCSECNDGKWTSEETQKKFHFLVFYMLGIVKLQDEI